VEDGGDTTAGQLIESSDKVRAKKKTGLEKGGSSKPADLLSVIKEVDEIMNTPVNKDTSLDEVEELRINMLKHSDFLRKREEHVESLAKKIEKEQEKMSAKTSRQLFEEKRSSKNRRGKEPPAQATTAAQDLGFDWRTAPQRVDRRGDVVFCTPILNAAAVLDTLDDNTYTAEEKLANARHFVSKALEQQARADSYGHMADARGGDLESKSGKCKVAPGADPEGPSGSSSHGDKRKATPPPKKTPPPKPRQDENSRTGSRGDLPPPAQPRRDNGGSRGNGLRSNDAERK
jgi:hypothetical protein